MLTGLVLPGLTKDQTWVMPAWYKVRTMSARILENSPEYIINETDLAGVLARPSVNTLTQRRPDQESNHRGQSEGRLPSATGGVELG